VKRLEKLREKIEKKFDKDNMLKSKIAQDPHLLLQLIKRLKVYLSCREKPQE